MCTSLPLLSPLGRKLTSFQSFKTQYQSLVSFIRGSRRSNRGSRSSGEQADPKVENKRYIELEEAETGLKRDVDPMFQATVQG